jgi:hypothetical protein
VYGWVQNINEEFTAAEPLTEINATEGDTIILTVFYTKNLPRSSLFVHFKELETNGSAILNEDYTLSVPSPLSIRADPILVNVTLLRDGVAGEGEEEIELTLVQDLTISPLEESRILAFPTVRITVQDSDDANTIAPPTTVPTTTPERLPGDPCFQEKSIRIIGSNDTSVQQRGFLEVCLNGVWGSVCDDYWTDIEAQVACRQLKLCSTDCVGSIAVLEGQYYDDTAYTYWLDNVNCAGDEESLFDCNYLDKAHNCRQNERAGVKCPAYKDPRIRLVAGGENSGLVEVYHDAEWRSVCDNHWTNAEAKVACRALGLASHGATAYKGGRFREGEQVKYWLDDISCVGYEESLLDCYHGVLGAHNCGQGERARVSCQSGK